MENALLEDIVSCARLEKFIEGVDLDRFPDDEVLELYMDDIPDKYSMLLMAMVVGMLDATTFDVGIDNSEELQAIRERIEDISTYLEYSVRVDEESLRVKKRVKNIRISYMASVGISARSVEEMVDNCNSRIDSDDSIEDDNFLEYISNGNEVRILLPSNRGNRNKSGRTEHLRKLFGNYCRQYGLDCPLEVTNAGNEIIIRRTRTVEELDLVRLRDFDSVIGGIEVRIEDFDSAVVDLGGTEFSAFVNNRVDDKEPSQNESALLAYAYLMRNEYKMARNIVDELEIGHNPPKIAEALRLRLDYQIRMASEVAHQFVSSLGDIEISMESALSYLTDDDKFLLNTSTDFDNVGDIQGILGELFAIGFLSKRMDGSDEKVEFVEGTPDSRYAVEISGHRVMFAGIGKTVKVSHPATGINTEIDALLLYDGIPIVIEAKTANKDEKYRSKLIKGRLIRGVYGVQPVHVRINIRNEPEEPRVQRLSDHTVITLPNMSELIDYRDRLAGGERF